MWRQRASSGSIARRRVRARERKRDGVVAVGARRTTEFGSGRRSGEWCSERRQRRRGRREDNGALVAAVRARAGSVAKEKKGSAFIG